MKGKEWEWLVGISSLVLLIIFICKILFWISVFAFMVCIIWLIIAIVTKNIDIDFIKVPLIVIISSIIVGLITFGIGYQFEKSELGKPFVDLFKTVVDVDNNLNNISNQINNQLINSLPKNT